MAPEDLRQAVAGHMAAFLVIAAQPHETLAACGGELQSALVVEPAGVSRVLRGLQSGQVAPATAQSWASFVRRGYVARTVAGPHLPLEIEYEHANEELLAEVISRLDELGDRVDGTLSDSELAQLLARLSAGIKPAAPADGTADTPPPISP